MESVFRSGICIFRTFTVRNTHVFSMFNNVVVQDYAALYKVKILFNRVWPIRRASGSHILCPASGGSPHHLASDKQ